ncbi:WD40/YVTN/BNR-like repeat-containing protein [Rubrivivax rivuli]|uniref:Glycosyl hydrolase n=1 Tax=Rubrivivax rivuli TaxID=1862385 RepID=A0A437RFG3_9BURK|nr:YCF48-related protein [Rubrivivax rivuli]RVU45483.1 glycosyl hydrolase [Rubrivivax rivuli]
MKRRRLLLGAASLGPLSPFVAGWAAAAAPALPAVLSRPATASPLATQGALLAAARAGQRLVVGGERGTILFSDDGGQKWTQARVPAQLSITSLVFANEREGWAAGHFGALLRTADGGQSWALALDGVRAAQVLLAGATDDAQRQSAQRKLDEGADKPFFDLALVDGKLFAVGAYGLAVETADGRSFQPLAARLPNPRQFHLYGLRAAGSRLFAVGEQGLLLRSTDAGATFAALPSPYKGSFFGVMLLGESTVLAYGLRGNIWRSADNGNTWAQVANPVPVSLSAGVLLSDGTAVLVAQNGDLLFSRDQGQTFQRRPAAPPFPAANLAVADEGHLLLTGLRGLKRLALG